MKSKNANEFWSSASELHILNGFLGGGGLKATLKYWGNSFVEPLGGWILQKRLKLLKMRLCEVVMFRVGKQLTAKNPAQMI